MYMKFINIPVFIVSLAIGIFLAYITTPLPGVIYVYPNPENIDNIQYKDESGTCFGFSSYKTECPKDANLVRNYPVQSKTDHKSVKQKSNI